MVGDKRLFFKCAPHTEEMEFGPSPRGGNSCEDIAPEGLSTHFLSDLAGTGIKELREEVIPVWVQPFNEIDFPVTSPLFHRLLALDGEVNVAKIFKPDEPMKAMVLAEPFKGFFPVLRDTVDEIAGHANVERAVRSVGDDVNEVHLVHGCMLQHHTPIVIAGLGPATHASR